MFIISFLLVGSKAFAPPSKQSNPSYLKQANKYFSEKKFSKAISYYRKYLRGSRRDANTWNRLAVAYYYAGLPVKALSYLKKWEKRSSEKSYNQFYQGLIYLSLNYPDKAKIPLTKAAHFINQYAARSVYELAVLEYQERNTKRVQYWVGLYRQRFPTGTHIQTIMRIERSLADKTFINDLKGNPRPDLDESLFKYSRYSLYPKPHYWFFQTGYDYSMGSQNEPDLKQPTGVKEAAFTAHNLMVYGGIGLGPIYTNGATSWIGYNYKQDWITNDTRYQTFIKSSDDMTDYISYFPFRADLLERTHQLYGDLRYKITDSLYVGAFGQQEFKFIGSEYIPGPEGNKVDQNRAKVSETSLLIPWIGFNYYKNFYTLGYLYLRKVLSEDIPEHSNKTYSFSTTPVMSYGINHRMPFPQQKIEVVAEAFQYEFIYNDYLEDYTRMGLLLSIKYDHNPKISVHGLAGYYQDQYQIPIPRQAGCKFEPVSTHSAREPEQCTRVDTGMIIQTGLSWNYAQFKRLAIKYTYVNNQNATQTEYERTEHNIVATYTMAFPNVDRVMRFVERASDIALTKKDH